MSYLNDIKNIVFDIGDVLFTWSPASNPAVTSQDLRRLLRSPVWFEYEKGNMSQEECYAQFTTTAFQAARDSLSYDHGMFSLLRDIKTREHYYVYALSNISSPDHQVPKTKVAASTWNPFDGVFTSAAAGERKLHLGFYRHVLSHTQKWIRGTIFIDDKVENASSLGIICGDPVVRAREYLSENQMCLITYTSENEPIEDNIAQLLILEATGDRRLVDFVQPERQFNFFKSVDSYFNMQTKGRFITVDYPYASGPYSLPDDSYRNDVDTTTILKEIDLSLKYGVMDEILGLCNSDLLDPVVCVNALTVLYAHNQGQDLSTMLDWCCDIFQNRVYMHGTLYYAPPEAFFASVRKAMRIPAAATVGIKDSIDYQRLRTLQEKGGSWPTGWLYRYGLTGVLLGNKEIEKYRTDKVI
ncbi:hypothetical protein JB92DRAFT_3083874 [Gautieria morchelliformis]|nr:hypothetical protein JB92DRAFT_3083874 [Gautieria morchelliformis]